MQIMLENAICIDVVHATIKIIQDFITIISDHLVIKNLHLDDIRYIVVNYNTIKDPEEIFKVLKGGAI